MGRLLSGVGILSDSEFDIHMRIGYKKQL
jgi:hypothetical protein